MEVPTPDNAKDSDEPSTRDSISQKRHFFQEDPESNFTHYDKNYANFNIQRQPNRFVDMISSFLCCCCTEDSQVLLPAESEVMRSPLYTL